MRHKLYRLHADTHSGHHHGIFSEVILMIGLALVIFASPASAAMRFQERSLLMETTEPGATTSYTLSFRYMSPQAVGSLDMLFCVDPIPHHACVTPPGLDVSDAQLSEQAGEDGFTISQRSTNRLVLSRPAEMIDQNVGSVYRFNNIVNPTDESQSFAIRLKSHQSNNATGPQIDFGSVKTQVASGVIIQTQVPPMLIFCVAEEVSENCTETNDNFYTNMGEMSTTDTLVAQSQMSVGTNASGGFAITVNGSPFTAGTSVVPSPTTPTASRPGTNQFGINLVANTAPSVGLDPIGLENTNIIVSSDYGVQDAYKYEDGDLVAYSPNVSLMGKFTVSYIVNASPDLRAGVYTTTLNYIASGRF